jgi:hypothetical protein
MLSVIFSLIFNEVLIFLHNCLDSTHTNCPTATRGVFSVRKGKICHFMVTVIATLQKYNHTNYVEKPATSREITS